MLLAASLLGKARYGADTTSVLADSNNGDVDDSDDMPPANYGRRRSRAVLYQLSGHYKQEKIKTKLKLNNVSMLVFDYQFFFLQP